MGALISIFFLMFRLMFLMLRYTLVLTVWTFQVMVILIASLTSGGSRALPRLRL